MRDDLYFSLQNQILDLRGNVSALARKLTATQAERDRAEQALRDLQHQYDLLNRKYNEVISR